MRQTSYLVLRGHKGQSNGWHSRDRLERGNWVYNLRAHLHRTDITVGAKNCHEQTTFVNLNINALLHCWPGVFHLHQQIQM